GGRARCSSTSGRVDQRRTLSGRDRCRPDRGRRAGHGAPRRSRGHHDTRTDKRARDPRPDGRAHGEPGWAEATREFDRVHGPGLRAAGEVPRGRRVWTHEPRRRGRAGSVVDQCPRGRGVPATLSRLRAYGLIEIEPAASRSAIVRTRSRMALVSSGAVPMLRPTARWATPRERTPLCQSPAMASATIILTPRSTNFTLVAITHDGSLDGARSSLIQNAPDCVAPSSAPWPVGPPVPKITSAGSWTNDRAWAGPQDGSAYGAVAGGTWALTARMHGMAWPRPRPSRIRSGGCCGAH